MQSNTEYKPVRFSFTSRFFTLKRIYHPYLQCLDSVLDEFDLDLRGFDARLLPHSPQPRSRSVPRQSAREATSRHSLHFLRVLLEQQRRVVQGVQRTDARFDVAARRRGHGAERHWLREGEGAFGGWVEWGLLGI